MATTQEIVKQLLELEETIEQEPEIMESELQESFESEIKPKHASATQENTRVAAVGSVDVTEQNECPDYPQPYTVKSNCKLSNPDCSIKTFMDQQGPQGIGEITGYSSWIPDEGKYSAYI